MDSSEDEKVEDFELQHWNNWSEPQKELPVGSTVKNTVSNNYVFNNPRLWTNSSIVTDSRFGNWIPPINFINFRGGSSSLIKLRNEKGSNELDVSVVKCSGKISQEWNINADWGKRVELNDVTKYSDGEKIWTVINLGLFGQIKLWVNEYKNICVLAEGIVSKIGSTEAILITVVNADILRKILHLTTAQWASLCEAVMESNTCLNFDASLDCDLTNKSSLYKMWFFVCKRRHFLQDQCMLIKLSGAVKCLKRFEIIPKLVVQDVRNLKGEFISET